VGLGALREHGSGGSGAGPVGSGAWGEADRERAGAWSFGQRQGAQKAGQERSSGTLPLGVRFGGPDRGGGGGRFGNQGHDRYTNKDPRKE
jgi:hypothetical protein